MRIEFLGYGERFSGHKGRLLECEESSWDMGRGSSWDMERECGMGFLKRSGVIMGCGRALGLWKRALKA